MRRSHEGESTGAVVRRDIVLPQGAATRAVRCRPPGFKLAICGVLFRGGWSWHGPVLCAAFLVGALLRIMGVRFGLPLHVHPDEWVVVRNAVDLAARNSFEPGYFGHPDHFLIKLGYLLFSAYSHVVYGLPADVTFSSHPGDFYVLARLMTVTFGILMIPLAYLVGRKFGRTVGVLAASATALWPPFVNDSHYATPDVPLAFAMMLVVYFCTRYVEAPVRRHVVLASASVGCAITIKFPGVVAAVMVAFVVIAAAVRDRRWLRIASHGTIAALALLGSTFVISPVLFTNVSGVLGHLTEKSGTGHLGGDGLGPWGNGLFYLDSTLLAGGVVFMLAAALGAIWVIRNRPLGSAPLWIGAVYLVVLSQIEQHWSRYAMPMYLTTIFLAPIGFCHAYAWMRTRSRPAAWGVFGTLVTISAAHLASAALATSVELTLPDTRHVMARSLLERGVTARNTLFEGYTPFQPGSPATIFESVAVHGSQLVLTGDARQAGIDYVMLSSQMYRRYDAEPKYAAEQAIYTRIRALPKVAELRPNGRTLSPWEPVSIWRSLTFTARVRGDGLTGPAIVVFDARQLVPRG
jgi:Dolichyl-phosphate-mannose-protein mannosyltransferase